MKSKSEKVRERETWFLCCVCCVGGAGKESWVEWDGPITRHAMSRTLVCVCAYNAYAHVCMHASMHLRIFICMYRSIGCDIHSLDATSLCVVSDYFGFF